MIIHIDFRKKKLKRLRLLVSPQAKFSDIFTIFEEIRFFPGEFPRDNVVYALLELVNNSLRAQRETKSLEPILVGFNILGAALQIDIKDQGGGFNPKKLPFDIDSPVANVDINGKTFQEYRKFHKNTRFGMGLYIAKRTFSDFSLAFVDVKGEERTWAEEAAILGTHIRLVHATKGERS